MKNVELKKSKDEESSDDEKEEKIKAKSKDFNQLTEQSLRFMELSMKINSLKASLLNKN